MPTDPTATPDTTHVAVPMVADLEGTTYIGACTQDDFTAEQVRDTPAAAKADVAEHVAVMQQ